jgi:hypothetical protein
MSTKDTSSAPSKGPEADSPGLAKLKARAKAITDQWAKDAEAQAKYQEEFDAKQQEMQEKADLNRGV